MMLVLRSDNINSSYKRAASQEEQNGTSFSFVAPSSKELRVRQEI